MRMDIIPLPDNVPHATLLIADADTGRSTELQQALIGGGYTVVSLHIQDDLTSHVTEHKPHLVILGVQPDRDATRLCQITRSALADYYVPIICLTNEPPNGHLPQIPGADVTLHWPFNAPSMTTWLHYLLRHTAHVNSLLEENNRLEAASRSAELLKREIITSVSHEFRTPLVQIKASVSMLADDVRSNGSYPQPSLADMATQAVARLEGVVDTIRQLAQTHNISLGPVIVREAIELALRFLGRSWNSRGAARRIKTYVQADLPLVLADKRALARLLQLLLDNALKFSDEDSLVVIRAECEPESCVRISVQDSGIGIHPDEHTRIFEAFYQVDASDTRRYDGTGNGLALAMLLARGMNTEIEVSSCMGEGSTFSFVLPVADLDQFTRPN